MTTDIRAESVALLAEALQAERMANHRVHASDRGHSAAILAASPTLARRLAFATAWEMAEAALPEGWLLQTGMTVYPEPERRFAAIAHKRDWRPEGDLSPFVNIHPDDHRDANGPTPTAALLALVEKLREATR